jgi:EpsI family protein
VIHRRNVTLGIGGFLAGIYATGNAMRPDTEYAKLDGHTLESLMPARIGDWSILPQGLLQVDLTAVERGGDPTKGPRPTYDEILSRSYKNLGGDVVMLSLAYGRKQSQELRIHRPELCYAAQGFSVKELGLAKITTNRGVQVPVKRLMTENRGRLEPVSYWIRIGDTITTNPWQTRGEVLRQGLQGVVPDGILVRASMIIPDATKADEAFAKQERFLTELMTQGSAPLKQVLAAI